MTTHEITLNSFSIRFGNKLCFDSLTARIPFMSRIAIIGENGCGKSSLLHALMNAPANAQSEIQIPADCKIGYVPQLLNTPSHLSGGQRFQKALSAALQAADDVLLLDEPTNHLDKDHKSALIKMLQKWPATLIFASHDEDFIRQCAEQIWHIENEQVHIFHGRYQDYLDHHRRQLHQIDETVTELKQQQKALHQALMQEQSRAAKSKKKGEKSIGNRKWPTIVSHAKADRASQTASQKKAAIRQKLESAHHQKSQLYVPKTIRPNFQIPNGQINSNNLIMIKNGAIQYMDSSPVLANIDFMVHGKDRIAIHGQNASGKTSFIKAIMKAPELNRQGEWVAPHLSNIGYVDQHYGNLDSNLTVLESIQQLVPSWSNQTIRAHLRHFLFLKTERVETRIAQLSGGEKARLSLAHIAVAPPKLLILDEMTNNVDLESKQHIVDVLKAFPGAIIVISHEEAFIQRLQCHQHFLIKDQTLTAICF